MMHWLTSMILPEALPGSVQTQNHTGGFLLFPEFVVAKAVAQCDVIVIIAAQMQLIDCVLQLPGSGSRLPAF